MDGEGKARRVHIVGLGGVGFWLAVGLARSGHQLVLYDDDNLTGGLGHARLPLATPTTKKVDLLRGFLRVNIGGVSPEFVGARFTGNEASEGDLVVDCTDMPTKDRRTMWRRAAKSGARLLRVSYDGANSTVVIGEGMPITTDERASGYANVPSLALSLAAGGLGAETVLRMLAGDLQCSYVDTQIDVVDWVGQPALPEPEATIVQELARVGITDVAVNGR